MYKPTDMEFRFNGLSIELKFVSRHETVESFIAKNKGRLFAAKGVTEEQEEGLLKKCYDVGMSYANNTPLPEEEPEKPKRNRRK